MFGSDGGYYRDGPGKGWGHPSGKGEHARDHAEYVKGGCYWDGPAKGWQTSSGKGDHASWSAGPWEAAGGKGLIDATWAPWDAAGGKGYSDQAWASSPWKGGGGKGWSDQAWAANSGRAGKGASKVDLSFGERSRSRSRDNQRRLGRENSGEDRGTIGDGGRLKFKDDVKKLSNKYRFLGGEHLCDQAGLVTPRSFRMSCITSCDSERFDTLKVALLNEEQCDLLLYILTGLPPTMKMADFGTTCKGEIRAMIRRSHKNVLRSNPNRLNGLGTEHDNLCVIAVRLGYPTSLLTVQVQTLVHMMRARVPGGCQQSGPN